MARPNHRPVRGPVEVRDRHGAYRQTPLFVNDEAPVTKRMKNDFRARALRALIVSLAFATLLSMLGAYGTHQLGLVGAWVYWFALIGGGMVLGSFGFRQVTHVWLVGRPWWAQWAVATVAMTVPMVGLVSVAQTVIGNPVSARHLVVFAGQVMLIVAAVAAVQMLVDPPPQPDVAPQPSASPGLHSESSVKAPTTAESAGPAFAKRLPPKLLGADIWALSAEDHYVRVHSSKGADLVLIRLADAIAEMDAVDGLRVHRSWWVAKAGVAQIRRRTEGGVVVLHTGVEAPISRSAMPDVIANGWL